MRSIEVPTGGRGKSPPAEPLAALGQAGAAGQAPPAARRPERGFRSALREQQARHVPIALLRCEMQRRDALIRAGIHIRAVPMRKGAASKAS